MQKLLEKTGDHKAFHGLSKRSLDKHIEEVIINEIKCKILAQYRTELTAAISCRAGF